MEPAKLETSIGSVYVEADTRDGFHVRSFPSYPHELEKLPRLTYLWLRLERCGDCWEFEDQPPKYRLAESESFGEVPLPPALVDELLALATEWANAHPEEFEKAARAEFDDLLLEMVDETFNELARISGDAQKRFREILDDPEFGNHASTALRRRVQKEAQRLRVMRLQVSGAAKAINTLAGRRPSAAGNQTAGQ
jgi:hypothetical protein